PTCGRSASTVRSCRSRWPAGPTGPCGPGLCSPRTMRSAGGPGRTFWPSGFWPLPPTVLVLRIWGMTDPIGTVGALADPVRRAACRAGVGAGRPVGRDAVAEALGVGRTVAAFPLDKLAAAGLLEVSYARRAGRSGPGAGRPAKLYQRAAAEVAVSLPPRNYDE